MIDIILMYIGLQIVGYVIMKLKIVRLVIPGIWIIWEFMNLNIEGLIESILEADIIGIIWFLGFLIINCISAKELGKLLKEIWNKL